MQNDSTAGYVSDIGYTYGYYSELNPVAARFALLAAGFAAPEVRNACELGFGQGLSINLHAAASTTRWWGNDFLPQQAAFAQSLADAAGSNAHLAAESFQDFCGRADLPDMDFIGLHGVWTWVNDDSRRTIVDFIRRKLKPGGIVYASYNTQPGWANVVPLRELFVDYADFVGGPGQSTLARVETAIGFTERLLACNPRFLHGNHAGQAQVRSILAQDRHYLAHEFFNRDWEPMSYARMVQRLAPAEITFAGPAHMLEHVDGLYMTQDQMALVKSVPDPDIRQSVRDFVLNVNFRRDYWVRGAKHLSGDEQREALEEQHVLLCRLPQEVTLRVGDARLSDTVYQPIIDELSHHQPRSIGDLARTLEPRGIAFGFLLQALVVLVGKQDVLPAQPPDHASATGAAKLNRHIIGLARDSEDVRYLASPLTGGGLFVPRFDQLFLLAIAEGEKTSEGWARSAWEALQRHKERLVVDGRAIVGAEESLALMNGYANDFAEKRLAGYRALRVA